MKTLKRRITRPACWSLPSLAGAMLCLGCLAAPDGGVEFDGMKWHHSHDPAGLLKANKQGHLVWAPRKPHQLTVHFDRPQPLAKIGDVVEFALLWKSRGDVLEGDCKKALTHDDCVEHLAGTGDFRMGLFDSGGRHVTRDGAGLESDVFRNWKGYQWRFFPHLRADELKRWYEPKPDGSRESHTNLRFWKRVKPDHRSLLASRMSYSTLDFDPFAGGFAAPQDEFRQLRFRFERISAKHVEASITFNGKTFSRVDRDPAQQPLKIDTFAIHMPNARPYQEVTFAPAKQSGKPLKERRESTKKRENARN